jgi:hypothetical protein
MTRASATTIAGLLHPLWQEYWDVLLEWFGTTTFLLMIQEEEKCSRK